MYRKMNLVEQIYFDLIVIFRIWLVNKICPEKVLNGCVFTRPIDLKNAAIITNCFFIDSDGKLAEILDEYTDECLDAIEKRKDKNVNSS
jgi:hypothetical protein